LFAVNAPTNTATTSTYPAGCTSVSIYSSITGQPCGAATATAPVVTVSSNPTLKLTYDSKHKESRLTSTFRINVTAGDQDIYLPKEFTSVGLSDSKGNNVYLNSSQENIIAVNNQSLDSSCNGTYGAYKIPAGDTVTFQLTDLVNPQQLFSGVYTGKISGGISYFPDLSSCTTDHVYFLNNISSQSTNQVAVVGETSPYITGVPSYTINADGSYHLVLTGVRFGYLKKDTIKITTSYSGETTKTSTFSASSNLSGTKISVNFPASLVNSTFDNYLPIQIINPSTGASNTTTLFVSGPKAATIQ